MSKTGNSASRARHRQQKQGIVLNVRRKKGVRAKRLARQAKMRKK